MLGINETFRPAPVTRKPLICDELRKYWMREEAFTLPCRWACRTMVEVSDVEF